MERFAEMDDGIIRLGILLRGGWLMEKFIFFFFFLV